MSTSQVPPNVSRIVIGEDKAAAIVAHLIRQSCWFQITPFPWDHYQVTVKHEAAQHLPAVKVWKDATDEELMMLAFSLYSDHFHDLGNGEIALLEDSSVQSRDDIGFAVVGHVWINFPEDVA